MLLHVPDSRFSPDDEVRLTGGEGSELATLQVEELYRISKEKYVKAFYDTVEPGIRMRGVGFEPTNP